MQILHGTWIPDPDAEFFQAGRFYLWIETTARQPELEEQGCYPLQLTGDELARTLTGEFKLQSPDNTPLANRIEPCYFLLPTVDCAPLPSLELSRYLEIALPETFEFEYWEVDGYPVDCAPPTNSSSKAMGIVPLLNELHFLTLHSLNELQLGSDLLFWFHFTQALKRIILKDHYIPALKYRPLAPHKSTAKKASTKKNASKRLSSRKKATDSQSLEQFKLYSGWEFIGDEYETLLEQYVEYMPLLCAAGFAVPHEDPQLYDPLTLDRKSTRLNSSHPV